MSQKVRLARSALSASGARARCGLSLVEQFPLVVDIPCALLRQQEPDRVADLLEMTLEPGAEGGCECVGICRHDDERHTTVPRLRVLLLVKLGPGISLPFALEDDNPELLGHLLRATDDRADSLGQMVDVLSMLEELVVLGMGELLRARILFMFEDQATANVAHGILHVV